MPYELHITPLAEAKLKKFDKELQRHFFKKIEKLRETPECGKPLRNVLAGSWELYFERSFRIIYSIDETDKIVKIESILHKNEF